MFMEVIETGGYMSDQCELLEKCSFFNEFKGNTDNVIKGWIRMYCHSKEKSETCERKKLRKKTGQAPPPNMTPTGKMIG